MFLDWADPDLDEQARRHLGRVAWRGDCRAGSLVGDRRKRCADEWLGRELGWMEPRAYAALGRRALGEKVIAPLRERGIDPTV